MLPAPIGPSADSRTLGPVALAFLGDGVYELMVRSTLIGEGNAPPWRLHQKAVQMVRASFQAKAAEHLAPLLTPQEADVLRRGRNSSEVTVPKRCSVREYRLATGLEALFGYLYVHKEQ